MHVAHKASNFSIFSVYARKCVNWYKGNVIVILVAWNEKWICWAGDGPFSSPYKLVVCKIYLLDVKVSLSTLTNVLDSPFSVVSGESSS